MEHVNIPAEHKPVNLSFFDINGSSGMEGIPRWASGEGKLDSRIHAYELSVPIVACELHGGYDSRFVWNPWLITWRMHIPQ